MSSQAFDMVPIQNENDGKVLGVLTEGTFVLPASSVRPVLPSFLDISVPSTLNILSLMYMLLI